MYIFFWILLVIILYSYIIYPILIYFISRIVRIFKKEYKKKSELSYQPEVTLFIAAYNEKDFIDKKVQNSMSLEYPEDKIHHIWVTDGSDDGTPEILSKYKNLKIFHQKERKGKIGAIKRGIQFVQTPIVIFSDANSIINKTAIQEIVKRFQDSKVGCVAGEKRISIDNMDNAVNSGEGIYWKYESFIKNSESIINSSLGAVGELFAIRSNLFPEIEDDTILDDFLISIRIAQKGYKIKYAPEAYAIEDASININEELKRKTRIAYGGFQAMKRLSKLFNPSKFPILTFQFISHKVFRWTLVPFSIFLIFFINISIAFKEGFTGFYMILLYLQIIFYLFVILGAILQSKKINLKILFTPYYLFIMNLSQVIGLLRYVKKNQSVNWERAKRK